MVKDWKIREEIFIAFHQWPVMIAFFLAGCLLGWASSYLWPASYRATTQVYVGLNPYRTYSDTTFLALARPKYSNIDDYQHWQMSQLEAAIYLEDFIADTLAKLRATDPYWLEIDEDQLRDMLDADWRSPGTWSLIAENHNETYAAQATEAWSEVVVARITEAVRAARDTFMIDMQLQQAAAELAQSERRQAALLATKERLQEWSQGADELPQDLSLEPVERWHILSLATQAAQFNPAWMALLEMQPPDEALPGAYQDWIDSIIVTIDEEASILRERHASLEQEYDELAASYSSEADASLSMSPNITIEGRESLPTDILRPSSLFVLVGGVIGLCLWILQQLVRIARKAQPGEQGGLEDAAESPVDKNIE